jgi:small subunit ribosomal protein S14
MSYSNYKKMLKQLKVKPAKMNKFIKHNAPKERSCGVATKRCSRCGRIRGHISQYGLDLCRQCFREVATKIGFKKYN